MRLTLFKTYLMFVLALSFIAQPAFSASISTAMQIEQSQRHIMVMATRSDGLKKEQIDCPHMKGHKMSAMSDSASNSDTSETEQDCMTHCQFCMSATFILSQDLSTFSRQQIFFKHVNAAKKLAGIVHFPEHEPPRTYS